MNRAVLHVEWRRGVQAILPSNLLAAALLAAALPVAAADAEAESRGSLRQTSPASTPPPAAAPEIVAIKKKPAARARPMIMKGSPSKAAPGTWRSTSWATRTALLPIGLSRASARMAAITE